VGSTSEFRPLHEINPLRLGWISDIAGGLADKDVLDVGCGGGILTEAMARAGARVTASICPKKALGVAQLHGLESGIAVDYRLIAAEALAVEAPARYAVVTCMEMLEHVPDPTAIVAACAALAKTGGTVVFATLNRNPKSVSLRDSRRGIRAEPAAARHPRLGALHSPCGARRVRAAREARTRGGIGHDLQPADARLSTRGGRLVNY